MARPCQAAALAAAVILLALDAASAATLRLANTSANTSVTAAVAQPHGRLRMTRAVQQKFDDIFSLKKQLDQYNAEDPDLRKRNRGQVPKRIQKKAAKAVEGIISEIPFVERGGCGERIPAAALGLRRSARAAAAWANEALLQVQGHPGEDSFSVPGAGADQTLKDDGLSEDGAVGGQAPFVKVLKDGFFEVGCFTDGMLEFGDKFGNNKDKYRETPEKGANVSIVKYKELIVEPKPVTPIVCFEFCRTLPDMVYFGINNGNDCYCAPYYKPAPGDDKQCSTPCEGDSTKMCGNEAKSTIYEMHLCADTAEVLAETMVGAKSALDFYYENIVLGGQLGSQMTRTGIAVEKLAGLAGADEAAKNAKAVKAASKDLSQFYRKGKDKYTTLLSAYKDAVEAKKGDLSDAKVMDSAQEAIRTMKATTGEVIGLAEEAHELVKLAYPLVDTEVFGEDPDPADPIATELAKGGSDGYDFRPASYAFDPTFSAKMSSCSGPVINSPMVGLGLPECAKVCEATTYPTKCVAFSFYAVKETEKMDGDGLSDLCVLLSDIKGFETFSCPEEKLLLLQRAAAREPEAASATAQCMVKMSEVATGYKPKKKTPWAKNERCFGDEASMPEAYKAFKMPEVKKMDEEGKDSIAPPP